MSASTSELAHDAANNPALLFNASVAKSGQATRDTGLVLTKEQVKHLQAYERAGLRLPTELNDVINYLGYRSGAGKGLEATDFQRTFTLVNDHARLWGPLRTDLLSAGDKLEIFAKKMQVYGSNMTRLFKRIDKQGIREKYKIETLEDLRTLVLQPGDEFPSFNDTDRKNFGTVLDRILQDIREQASIANDIKARLSSFGETLSTSINTEIKLRLACIDNNSLGAEIKALQQHIDHRSKAIEEKNKEYNTLVGKAIASVTTGIIMVIYTSVQAEKVRKERNKLRKEQAADVAKMESKSKILASLNKVRLDLQDLDLIVVDADIATRNLIVVWNNMTTYVESSRDQANLIENGSDLFIFEMDFELVVEPWVEIEKNARSLLNVFTQADIEFRQEYGDQQ